MKRGLGGFRPVFMLQCINHAHVCLSVQEGERESERNGKWICASNLTAHDGNQIPSARIHDGEDKIWWDIKTWEPYYSKGLISK